MARKSSEAVALGWVGAGAVTSVVTKMLWGEGGRGGLVTTVLAPSFSLPCTRGTLREAHTKLIKEEGEEVPPVKGPTKIKLSKSSLRCVNRSYLLSSVCKWFSGESKIAKGFFSPNWAYCTYQPIF